MQYGLRTNGCYHYGVLRRLPGSVVCQVYRYPHDRLGPLFLPSAAPRAARTGYSLQSRQPAALVPEAARPLQGVPGTCGMPNAQLALCSATGDHA